MNGEGFRFIRLCGQDLHDFSGFTGNPVNPRRLNNQYMYLVVVSLDQNALWEYPA
jgi:hypothetical protein